MTNRALSAAVALLALSGCIATAPVQQPAPSYQDELSTALRQAAQRAVDVRVRLAAMQAVPQVDAGGAGVVQPVPPEVLARHSPRINIDYVGPVENATKIVSRIAGWETTVAGKKRADVIVSLRHREMDAVSIFQDIGAQCGSRCDIHIELVEAGNSSVSLTFRD